MGACGVSSRSAGLAVALAALACWPAGASSFKEYAHSDSFGNLVIYSASGYKRIIVGAGQLASRFSQPVDTDFDPNVVYLHRDGSARLYDGSIGCPRGTVVVHGRSYMYGLDRNVTPVIAAPCQ